MRTELPRLTPQTPSRRDLACLVGWRAFCILWPWPSSSQNLTALFHLLWISLIHWKILWNYETYLSHKARNIWWPFFRCLWMLKFKGHACSKCTSRKATLLMHATLFFIFKIIPDILTQKLHIHLGYNFKFITMLSLWKLSTQFFSPSNMSNTTVTY